MAEPSDLAGTSAPGRMNLRLPQATFAAIDRARAAREGYVSRNTWLAEAVQEKLGASRGGCGPRGGGRTARG